MAATSCDGPRTLHESPDCATPTRLASHSTRTRSFHRAAGRGGEACQSPQTPRSPPSSARLPTYANEPPNPLAWGRHPLRRGWRPPRMSGPTPTHGGVDPQRRGSPSPTPRGPTPCTRVATPTRRGRHPHPNPPDPRANPSAPSFSGGEGVTGRREVVPYKHLRTQTREKFSGLT